MKPTPRQIKLIEKCFKLPVPSTMQACSSLIDYILVGCGVEDETKLKRIRKVRSDHHHFVGARIRITARQHKHHGRYGKVISLRTRSPEEIAAIREKYGKKHHPYVAVVSLGPDDKQRTYVPLSGLRVICRAEQKLLFTP